MPIELARERRVEPELSRGREVAHEQVTKRLERAHGERRGVGRAPGAPGADRPTRGRLPGVGLLGERSAALRAPAELRAEARAVQEMEIEPAARDRRGDARVEGAQRRSEGIEQR